MPLKEAQTWIDSRHALGVKRIGVSCNPIQRKIFLIADNEKKVIHCNTPKETRVIKDILHDYIGQLPVKDK